MDRRVPQYHAAVASRKHSHRACESLGTAAECGRGDTSNSGDMRDAGERRLTALICESGHVMTGSLEYGGSQAHCRTCGAATMSACPSCSGRILGSYPGSLSVMKHAPSFCSECGKPFPWQVAALERARKVARMQSEIHDLDEATSSALTEFAEDVARDRATPEEAATFGQWFRKKAGPEAARAVGGVLKDIATSTIADIIRKSMLGA
ncbi:MAG: DUF2321 domain-containing protein [Vulcanimicrobiaceae bacterium]